MVTTFNGGKVGIIIDPIEYNIDDLALLREELMDTAESLASQPDIEANQVLPILKIIRLLRCELKTIESK